MSVNPPGLNALELSEVFATNPDGERVCGITASFASGRFHVLRGPVGGGRDLLLRLLGLLEPPTAGEVLVDGSATGALSTEERAELRTQRFGFVFAAPFLLTCFNVIENVAMPLFKVSQVTPEEARRRTEALLAFVGMATAAETAVEDLSPGEQYRIAVARGLINEPAFLVVENLDGVLVGEELQAYVELLHRAGEQFGTTIIATASPTLPLLWPHRVLDVAGGVIIGDVELLPETGL